MTTAVMTRAKRSRRGYCAVAGRPATAALGRRWMRWGERRIGASRSLPGHGSGRASRHAGTIWVGPVRAGPVLCSHSKQSAADSRLTVTATTVTHVLYRCKHECKCKIRDQMSTPSEQGQERTDAKQHSGGPAAGVAQESAQQPQRGLRRGGAAEHRRGCCTAFEADRRARHRLHPIGDRRVPRWRQGRRIRLLVELTVRLDKRICACVVARSPTCYDRLVASEGRTGDQWGTDVATVRRNEVDRTPAGIQLAGGPTVLRMTLGAQLRKLREEGGISREQAGEAIRASHAKISRLELGRVGFKERD